MPVWMRTLKLTSWRALAAASALSAMTSCPPPAGPDAAAHDATALDAAALDTSALDVAANDAVIPDGARHDGARRDTAAHDAAPLDTAVRDAARPDQGPRDRAPTDYGSWDTAACQGEDAAWSADHGFCIRVPQYRDVPYTDTLPPTSYPMLDVDFVCTLDVGSLHGFAYVQARATSCRRMGGCQTTVDGAWTSVDGVTTATAATYSWGGNHHNELIRVSYGNQVYEYGHSSIGYGARSCHVPDCARVFAADGTTLIEDGCTSARTLPQVCVGVAEDGTVPPLVDTFAPCPGDPNFLDAGAGG